jgi:hypothetical protein
MTRTTFLSCLLGGCHKTPLEEQVQVVGTKQNFLNEMMS